ncbi:peptidoglycan-binding domain-containing protein [Nocardia sp. NPDC050712]|uniref:peptidoglycan-binding domain-containing protein n=1 Tax=Nocardia sp. NPDC050712 TaxID=3155518 RepID=UPI00340851F4
MTTTTTPHRARRLIAAVAVSAATLSGLALAAAPASATQAPSINQCQVYRPYLVQGVQNQAGCVAALQSFLRYYYGTGVDGKFGDQTRRHVEAFQRRLSIGIDGKVGPQTWGAIQAECNWRGDCDYHAAY